MKLAPVAFNGRFSGTSQPTGTQTAAFAFFNTIIRMPRDWPIVVFADIRFPGIKDWKSLPLVTVVDTPFQDWSRIRAQLWEQLILPILCRRWRCRVVHHPMNSCPFWSLGTRTVVTLHDINVYTHPEWYSFGFRFFYRYGCLPGLQRAELIVTISNYVQKQAMQFLNLSEERIKRIYHSAQAFPFHRSERGPLFPCTEEGYILCVGSLQPHKNLLRLIRAYEKLGSEFPGLELWVVGRAQDNFQAQPELAGLLGTPGVKVLGFLDNDELSLAYQHARVFCFPSLEEGFGMPILEAMSIGTLIVTSKTSCLPEIAGPDAELVDPYNEESIAQGLRRVLLLPDHLREKKREQGRVWASRFTWERAAHEYASLYNNEISEKNEMEMAASRRDIKS